MKIHFITYYDGLYPNKYQKAALELLGKANALGLFSTIKAYNAIELLTDNDFSEENKKFMIQPENIRGGGYWVWKPYIILKTLKSVDEGDIVIYFDSCTLININEKSKLKFLEYIDMVKKNKYGNLFFDHEHLIGTWCKMDTIDFFGAHELVNEREIPSGVLFTTANAHNKFIFKVWYEAMQNYHLCDDTPSLLPNLSTYREHRHDQSVLSLILRKLSPSSVIYNPNMELYWNTRQEEGKDYPIWIQANNY